MREIKFRWWDKSRESMVGPFDLFSYNGTSMSWYVLFIREQENSIFPMQYTGLKDKNGKEIYEGDIIQWPDPEVCGIDRGPVVYGDGWFYADGLCGKGSLAYEECKVIGNIYENPDLAGKQ